VQLALSLSVSQRTADEMATVRIIPWLIVSILNVFEITRSERQGSKCDQSLNHVICKFVNFAVSPGLYNLMSVLAIGLDCIRSVERSTVAGTKTKKNQ